jgi:arylformamidase
LNYLQIKEYRWNDSTDVSRVSYFHSHLSAAWHFLQDGNSIDMEPPDKFIGEAAIIDASGKNSITAEDFSGYDIRSNDIVLIYTSIADHRTDFAYLDVSAAEWMVEHGANCVGIDTASIEKYGKKIPCSQDATCQEHWHN